MTFPWRVDAQVGLPAPSPTPLFSTIDEVIRRTRPTMSHSAALVAEAMEYLQRLEVPNPQCHAGADPLIVLLRSPVILDRGRERIVVSSVAAHSGAVSPEQAQRTFGDTSVGVGYYGTSSKGAVYVDSYDDGLNFFNSTTAAVVESAIRINAHLDSAREAVYHEILHTFEPPTQSLPNALAEGFVEWFSLDFALTQFGLSPDVYPPYRPLIQDVAILQKGTSAKTLARAYFGGDTDAAMQLAVFCYEPIRALQPAAQRISDAMVDALKSWGPVKTALLQSEMKKSGSWYATWVGVHGVPPRGLQLPAPRRVTPPVGGGAGAPPPPPPQ
jgi:hypothetical protein